MKSKKILIVDDNDLNRNLYKSLLNTQWEVSTATNGLEAVLRSDQEKFDLILMDIQMPVLDGISAFRRMRDSGSCSCPVVAISAFAKEEERPTFKAMGFTDFIQKPIRSKEFLQSIHQLMGEELSEVPENETKDSTSILDKAIVQQLLKYNSGDKLKKVYFDFLLEFDELMILINEAFIKHKMQPAIECLHIMKGNSGTLGINTIFRLAQKAEQDALSDRWDPLQEKLIQLRNERNKIEVFINEETIFDL